MKRTVYILIGLAAPLLVAAAYGQTYDLGVDFTDDVIPSVGIGPDGVWSYGFDNTDLSGNLTNAVNFTPYSLHGGAPAGPDAYYTNGPLSIYQSPPQGGYGVISHDSDVQGERAIIRWTAPKDGTIYVDGRTWKFAFDIGNGRSQDFYVRINDGPFLASGTTSDSTLDTSTGPNDPNATGPSGNEINWGVSATVKAGDILDIFYLRHPGSVQDYSGYTETITYVPTGSPLITSQPSNLELAPGDSGTLSVGATGQTPLYYQWYKNGIAVTDATNATLAITNASATDIGLYAVVVSNTVNTRTSVTNVVDVNPPVSQVHDATADFSLVGNPTTRGWQYDADATTGGRSGLVGPKSPDWNNADFGNGQPGWLGPVANPQVGFARVVQNPNSYDVPNGTLVAFGPSSIIWTVPADDTNHYVYISGGLWNLRHLGSSGTWNIYKNGTLLTSGTIDDSTGTSTSPTNFITGSGGTDALVASYNTGDIFYLELLEADYQGVKFTLTTTNVAPDPWFVTQPASVATVQGGNATFTVAATGSNPLTYQWIFNGADLSGATNASVTITNVQPADVGTNYQVVVTSPGGTRHSRLASLTIAPSQPVGTPWDLAGDWQDGVIPPVFIGPEGAWSYGYSDITNGNDYFAPFTFTPYPYSDCTHSFVECPSYDITPNVSDPAASGGFGTYVLSHTSGVNDRPIIFRWTADRPITVNASGFAYSQDQNGRTQDFFVRKNSNPTFFASGTVDDASVSNPTNWAANGISLNTGDFIDLIVRHTPSSVQSFINVEEQIVEAPRGTPHISTQPSPLTQTASVGATVSYSVVATGNPTPTYQWMKDGVAIAGATGTTLTLSNVTTNNAGDYNVVVTNSVGASTSDTAILNVVALPPTITLARSGANIVLTWSGGGTLQSATNVVGPYNDIGGSSSPWNVVPTGSQQFYRVRQ